MAKRIIAIAGGSSMAGLVGKKLIELSEMHNVEIVVTDEVSTLEPQIPKEIVFPIINNRIPDAIEKVKILSRRERRAKQRKERKK
ncbi:hypothetical protein D3C87_1683780 [compost metagenome]